MVWKAQFMIDLKVIYLKEPNKLIIIQVFQI